MHWQAQLAHAADEHDLLGIVNDFLATWSPRDIAKLPPTARPGRVKSGDEVRYWSERLAEAFCEAQAETTSEHHRMLSFFIAAVQRLSTNAARGAGEQPYLSRSDAARGAGAHAA